MIKLSEILERCSLALQDSAALAEWAEGLGGNRTLLLQVGMPASSKELEQAPAVMLVPQPWNEGVGMDHKPYTVAFECRVRANDPKASKNGVLAVVEYEGNKRLTDLMELVLETVTAELEDNGFEVEARTQLELQEGPAAPALLIGTLTVTWRIPIGFAKDIELVPRVTPDPES